MSEQAWTQGTDKIAFSSKKPDIHYLNDELQRSLFYGGNMSRLTSSDDQRMCRWEGQSDDGKKHEEYLDQEPFPFEGASDVRNRLIDNTINQLVILLMTSWQRANIRVTGIEVSDAQQSSAAQTLMHWLVSNKLRAELEREAELWAQYTLQFGWSAVHIGWERRMAKKNDVITMADLEQVAAQGNGILQQALISIKGDTQTDLGVMLISQALMCDKKEAIRICKDLAKQSWATYEQPYISKNLPVVAALKPFDEIAFPPETVDLQEARCIFKRTFMSEVQFRSIGKAENWDEEFIEQAVNTAGKTGYLQDSNLIPLINTVPNAVEKANNLIEVVYSYARQLDDNGNSSIYYTVFCPMVAENTYAKHEILDYAHGMYPFVEFRRERLRRSIVESRGIPEVLYTDQEELKAQHDSIRDRTAMEVQPPLMVKKRLAIQNRIGPGQLLPVNSPDEYMYLQGPTGTPATAFNLMDRIEMKVCSQFGLYHPNLVPTQTQMTQQFMVNNFFLAWSEVYKQLFSLCMQYLTPEEIQRVAGIPIQVSEMDNFGMFDFSVKFDIREHDTDYVLEKLKTINQFVLPMDTAGAIDRNKLIRRLVEAIAPETAQEILIDQQTATQKQYKEVQNDLALMMLGLEAQYTENDPQANAKMQAMQDIMSKNPKAQQASQGDPIFQALLQNYAKNLQMSIMQQKNAQIGRTGVSPVGDQFAQAQQSGEPIEPVEPQEMQQSIAPPGVNGPATLV
jgi:hypothetical protein